MAIWVATRSTSSHAEGALLLFWRANFRGCPVEKKGRTVVIDINLIRKTPDVVRENIKKKFQDSKLPSLTR